MKDDSGTLQDAWLLVVLTDGTICDGGSRAVIAAGWVPAYSTSGKVTAWYYSRGC
jgi:hypothetical protein